MREPTMAPLAVLAVLLVVGTAALADITPVKIDAGTEYERTGVLVSQEGVCVVMTAAHRIDRRVSMSVTINDKIYPAALSWNGLRMSEPIDVALLRFSQPVQANCDSLAAPERIDAALRKPEGQLWLPLIGDQVSTPNVRSRQRDTKTITLAASESDSSLLTLGVSGAPVVFDGLIVAVLRENSDRQFRATRLDHFLRIAGDEVKLRSFNLAAPAPFTPYDIGVLPAAIADEVRKARMVREEAALVSRIARDVEARADEAAKLAEEEAKSRIGFSTNRSTYATQGGDSYSGEINNKNSFFGTQTTTFPKGYGVLKILTGQFKGEVRKCIWVNEGAACLGPMVTELSPTGGEWRRMEIERIDNTPSGPARIVFRSGVIGFVAVKTTNNREAKSWSMTIAGAGVYEHPDGRRYEGAVNGNGGNGLGAWWDGEGKLIRAGVWKDGQSVD